MKEILKHITIPFRIRLWGIEILYSGDDSFLANLVLLEKENSQVHILARKEGVMSFDAMFEIIDNKTPVVLSLRGKGLLHKLVERDPQNEFGIQYSLEKYFPGIELNDFHFQEETITDAGSYISLIRKQKLEQLYSVFDTHKIQILDIILGPFALNSIGSLITSSEKILLEDDLAIEIRNSRISKFEKASGDIPLITEYIIDEERLGYKQLIAYASGISYYLKHTHMTGGHAEFQRREYRFKRLSKIVGLLSIFGFFLILLINLFVNRALDNRYSKHQLVFNDRKALYSEYEKLTRQLERNKTYLSVNQFGTKSAISFYADRIARNLPGDIILSELVLFPAESDHRRSDIPVFDNSVIIVKGETENITVLNDWTGKLREESWIEKLTIFDIKQKQTASDIEFELHLIQKTNLDDR